MDSYVPDYLLGSDTAVVLCNSLPEREYDYIPNLQTIPFK